MRPNVFRIMRCVSLAFAFIFIPLTAFAADLQVNGAPNNQTGVMAESSHYWGDGHDHVSLGNGHYRGDGHDHQSLGNGHYRGDGHDHQSLGNGHYRGDGHDHGYPDNRYYRSDGNN